MRRQLVLKSIVATTVVILTHFTTVKLMGVKLQAQPNFGPVQRADYSPPGLESSRITPGQATANIARSAATRPHDVLFASSKMISASIKAGGKSVNLQAKIKLMDKNTDMKYMWAIKVYDQASLKVLDVRTYENQMFSLPTVDEQDIEFHERIEIPPGSYIVRLLLYRNEPGFSMRNSDRPDFDRIHSVWRFGEKVAIQE